MTRCCRVGGTALEVDDLVIWLQKRFGGVLTGYMVTWGCVPWLLPGCKRELGGPFTCAGWFTRHNRSSPWFARGMFMGGALSGARGGGGARRPTYGYAYDALCCAPTVPCISMFPTTLFYLPPSQSSHPSALTPPTPLPFPSHRP